MNRVSMNWTCSKGEEFSRAPRFVQPASRRALLRRFLALRAYAENVQRVIHIRVTHLARHAREAVGDAEIERLHLAAIAANDVVMVMLAAVEFIAIRAVAEVAAPHETDLLHRRQAAVDRHEVALAVLQPRMQGIGRERAVLADEQLED